MYSTLLSVLFVGLLPMLHAPGTHRDLGDLSVAAPSPLRATVLGDDIGERLTASGVLVVDYDSGQQLYGRSARVRHPMGSLTKLMTALVILEHHSLDERVTVPAIVTEVEGQSAHLKPGSHFTVGDLLSALLIPSANDAAITLAIHHSGSVDAFVAAMNDRARSLGLRDTSYGNPAGFDDPQQWSTPRDVAILASYVLRAPELHARLATREARIVSEEGQAITLVHTHSLLQNDPDVLAGKTGTTPGAGQCLLSLVREGSREYLVVLLGSRERYTDMRLLLQSLTRVSNAI